MGVWTGAAAMESSMEVPQNARDRVAIGSRMAQMIKSLTAMWETLGSIPGSGRSSREGNGNLLQYSCLVPHRQRNLASYSSRGHKELDTTEWLTNT